MGLLEEIQLAAIDGSVGLGTLLRMCRLLAARLGSAELAEWVKFESEGYPTHAHVPSYRISHPAIKATFSGPFGSGIKNAGIPTYLVDKFCGEGWTEFRCRQSAASIEATLEDAKSGSLQINLDNLMLLLQGNVYKDYACVAVWGELPTSTLTDIQNGVRNRVLELSIQLAQDHPLAAMIEGTAVRKPSEGKLVGNIINATIYGSANVAGTANNSTMVAGIPFGDMKALLESLTAQGVDETDLQELAKAVTAEPNVTNEKFGKRVAAWVSKMIGKAATGAWSIGVSAAGGTLEAALKSYYGLK